jgi:hypothetical protein
MYKLAVACGAPTYQVVTTQGQFQVFLGWIPLKIAFLNIVALMTGSQEKPVKKHLLPELASSQKNSMASLSLPEIYSLHIRAACHANMLIDLSNLTSSDCYWNCQSSDRRTKV